ncbi:MAG: DUF951 domain-containing protein [Chloroflexi bacterium]|nr:DUF951 domain-containing protein [Chloroflexota bacterium]
MDKQYQLDDLITLKKPHPCGSVQWKVVRLGAEIGLECLKCKHRVLLSRRELARKMKGQPIHTESTTGENPCQS